MTWSPTGRIFCCPRNSDGIQYAEESPGASHDHTFMGNTSTNGDSVTGTLYGGATRCKAPGDSSAYWMPSL
ncbi:DUF1996 domain-containing protein, partial [Streptomyces solincola]|uniref:DUF1996 domain-containing protein n=1 Tax=Streptomyces solincola TaxID=2100817 RepID=UPI00389AE7D0